MGVAPWILPQRVIIGAGKGIACFAVNAHHGLVAYAEKVCVLFALDDQQRRA